MNNPPDAPGGKTVTVADVASAAGVAPSTVSYVITGKRPISPRTRRRVMESIRALGYQRPGAPGSASGGRVGVVAVAVPPDPGRDSGFGTEFVDGAIDAARAHCFDRLLLTRDTGSGGLHRVFHSALADAAIVVGVAPDDPRVPPLLASHVPAVLVGGRPGDHPGLTHLGFDHAAAAAACVAHLAGLGHRSIVHIGHRAARPTGFAEGLEAAATRHAVRVSPLLVGAPAEAEEADRCVDTLLGETATGVVVDDETALPLVLAALERRGLRVPGDLSLVAVCPETVASRQRIPLTTVVVPARALGARAVERAARMLDVLTSASVELLAPEVITRGSTGPA